MSAIQKYPEFDNNSGGLDGSMLDYLSAILYGGKCISYKSFTFDDSALKSFADLVDGLPAGAKSALVIIEADTTEVDQPRVARFTQDGTTDPTTAIGMPVGDNGSFEIRGSANLAAFKIIGITAGKTHTLRVEFYGAG